MVPMSRRVLSHSCLRRTLMSSFAQLPLPRKSGKDWSSHSLDVSKVLETDKVLNSISCITLVCATAIIAAAGTRSFLLFLLQPFVFLLIPYSLHSLPGKCILCQECLQVCIMLQADRSPNCIVSPPLCRLENYLQHRQLDEEVQLNAIDVLGIGPCSC